MPPIPDAPVVLEANASAFRTVRSACQAAAQAIDPGRDPVLAGWCVEVSLVARVAFGGDLIEGRVGGERHYWNRLPDGREIDFTSDQYGGDGFVPLASGAVARVPDPAPIETVLFAKAVLEALSVRRDPGPRA